jgi:hypothetical protein
MTTDDAAPTEPLASPRTETDEELLSIPDPNLTGKLVGEVIEGPFDADR